MSACLTYLNLVIECVNEAPHVTWQRGTHIPSWQSIRLLSSVTHVCHWLLHANSQPVYPWFFFHWAVFTLNMNAWNIAPLCPGV